MAELSQAGDHAILVTTDRQYWVFVELSPQKYVDVWVEYPLRPCTPAF
jgi:hypothetical protein